MPNPSLLETSLTWDNPLEASGVTYNRVIPKYHSSEPEKHPPNCIISTSSWSFCSCKFHSLAPWAVQMSPPLSATQQEEGEATPGEHLALPHLFHRTWRKHRETTPRGKGTFLLWRAFLPLVLANSPLPTQFISESPSDGTR